MFITYLVKTFKLVLGLVLIIVLTRTFLIEPGVVNGKSMENTYLDGEIFLVFKPSVLFTSPKRGQIVQFRHMVDDELIIKRVIGLPGEQVIIKQNKVYIREISGDIIELEESYLKPGVITNIPEGASNAINIPENSYYLLGDNRPQSNDSRNFGPVHRSEIYGQIINLPLLN